MAGRQGSLYVLIESWFYNEGEVCIMYNEKIDKYEGYIYCIYNKLNSSSYIGQTTRTIEARFKSHKVGSKNFKRSIYLYSDVDIFGWDNFDVFEIEKITTDTLSELKTLLDEKEIFYIAKYNTLYPNGYNISKGGWILPNTFDSCKVYKFDLDGNILAEYDSMSDAAYNNNISQSDISNCCNGKKIVTAGGYRWSKTKDLADVEIKPHKKRVVMYDLNGNMLKIFRSSTDASISVFKDKSKRSGISKCVNGENKTAYGYIWRYYEDVLDNNNNIKSNIGCDVVIKSNTRSKTDANNIRVCKFNLNGEYIRTYSSIKEASTDSDVGYNSIRACLNGKQNIAGGFRWKVFDNNYSIEIKENKKKKKVHQFDLFGEYVASYESLAKASESTNICYSSIQKCASGENKTGGGYIWKYDDYYKK